MGIKNGQEMGTLLVTEALTAATGDASITDWFEFLGTANVAIWGAGVGTVIMERSFDDGVTAIPVTNLGAAVSFTSPASEIIFNREAGVLHRFRRTVSTSGTMSVRASQ
jgi:hypothetical protein